MTIATRGIAVLLLAVLASGCATNRAGVTELSRAQNRYFADLDQTLDEGRTRLAAGLDTQLRANNKRRRELVEWTRDLERAEVLLQVDSDVTGNRRLLSLQLAQLDLQRADALHVRDETSAMHVAAIMEMYDRVLAAIAELQSNNAVITEYLGSGDAEFVVRSIDIDGIVAAAAGIQRTRESLGAIETRSEEQRRQEREQVQQSVDRARGALIRAFELVQ